MFVFLAILIALMGVFQLGSGANFTQMQPTATSSVSLECDIDPANSIFASKNSLQLATFPCHPKANACANKKVDIMLVLDRTGSMEDMLNQSKEASKAFIKALTNSAAGPTGNVRIGLVTYAYDRDDNHVDITNLDSPLTTDYASVENAITGLHAFGFTCIQCGISPANNEFINNPNPDTTARKIVILLSDGQANTTSSGNKDTSSNCQNTKNAAISAADDGRQNQGIEYYVIGYGPYSGQFTDFHGCDDTGEDVDEIALKRIANQPDTKYYYYKPDANTWKQAYEEIFNDICAPTN